jgi:hypothetical protein
MGGGLSASSTAAKYSSGSRCRAAKPLTQAPQRFASFLRRDLAVDVHGDGHLTVSEDLHRHARMHVHGHEQGSAGTASGMRRDLRNPAVEHLSLNARWKFCGSSGSPYRVVTIRSWSCHAPRPARPSAVAEPFARPAPPSTALAVAAARPTMLAWCVDGRDARPLAGPASRCAPRGCRRRYQPRQDPAPHPGVGRERVSGPRRRSTGPGPFAPTRGTLAPRPLSSVRHAVDAAETPARASRRYGTPVRRGQRC